MTKKAKVTMYLDRVMMKVEDATEEVLHKAALEVEAQSKVNVVANNQVVTGFMLNAIYVESQRGSTFGSTWPGSEKIKAPQLQLPRRYAATAIVAGAVYSIYQEAMNPFLRPAAQTVMSRLKGIAEPIYKVKIRD